VLRERYRGIMVPLHPACHASGACCATSCSLFLRGAACFTLTLLRLLAFLVLPFHGKKWRCTWKPGADIAGARWPGGASVAGLDLLGLQGFSPTRRCHCRLLAGVGSVESRPRTAVPAAVLNMARALCWVALAATLFTCVLARGTPAGVGRKLQQGGTPAPWVSTPASLAPPTCRAVLF